ncbi:hypothetical protein GCM10009809_23950 [Isoptericola hypogeus]|uniref:Uncharacterized protein n=1 Tax=Isoptericola hypogeus TaxID=300179 RepID=A0ABP4VNX4_9MICO
MSTTYPEGPGEPSGRAGMPGPAAPTRDTRSWDDELARLLALETGTPAFTVAAERYAGQTVALGLDDEQDDQGDPSWFAPAPKPCRAGDPLPRSAWRAGRAAAPRAPAGVRRGH